MMGIWLSLVALAFLRLRDAEKQTVIRLIVTCWRRLRQSGAKAYIKASCVGWKKVDAMSNPTKIAATIRIKALLVAQIYCLMFTTRMLQRDSD